jgi:hypothetical protein
MLPMIVIQAKKTGLVNQKLPFLFLRSFFYFAHRIIPTQSNHYSFFFFSSNVSRKSFFFLITMILCSFFLLCKLIRTQNYKVVDLVFVLFFIFYLHAYICTFTLCLFFFCFSYDSNSSCFLSFCS